MNPNAYEAARTYARYLRDFNMIEKGAVLRLEPHRNGIAVVCEPGPNPAIVQNQIGRRGTLVYWPEDGDTGFTGDNISEMGPARVMPMPVFADSIRAEAWDAVTLVFMPKDGTNATMFPEI